MERDERFYRLPKWAQDTIARLEERLAGQHEPLIKELATLRPKVELLKRKNEAMQELLDCAAKGGHRTAEEIVKILESYDLTLTKHEE